MSLLSDAAAFGMSIPGKVDITVQKPGKRPTSGALNELNAAYEKRVKDISNGRPAPGLALELNTVKPGLENRIKAMADADDYGSSEPLADGNSRVYINPNADRAYFAHELGHVAAQTTDFGQTMHQMRNKAWGEKGNRRLSDALMLAAALTGGSSAALTEGDGEYLGALALAAGASAPTLIDEALATKNALAILETADMRATLGQRARLAGGLLSYLGPALAVGATAPLVGNQFD